MSSENIEDAPRASKRSRTDDGDDTSGSQGQGNNSGLSTQDDGLANNSGGSDNEAAAPGGIAADGGSAASAGGFAAAGGHAAVNHDGHAADNNNAADTIATTTETTPVGMDIRDGTPAAKPSSKEMKRIEGTKLQPLMNTLAAQPVELHSIIASAAKEALDLSTNISQRESSHRRFKEPMIQRDPKTQRPVKDPETGEVKTMPFIPRSFRKNDPLKCSTEVNEDTKIIAVMKRGKDIHEKYKSDMAGICKEISGLEIEIRKEKLVETFATNARVFAQSHVLVKQTYDGPNGTKCDLAELADNAVLTAIKTFPEYAATSLYTDNAGLADAYTTKHGIDIMSTQNWDTDIDIPFCNAVAERITPLLLGFTADLITHHQRKDKDREVSASLKEFLGKLEMDDANEELETALDNTESLSEANIESLMNKLVEKCTGKHIQKMKSILRKKSSGGAEVQAQRPGNNGTNQSGNTNGRSSKKSKQKSKKSSQQQSSKRKHDEDYSSDESSDEEYDRRSSNRNSRRRSSSRSRKSGKSGKSDKSRGTSRSRSRGPSKKVRFEQSKKNNRSRSRSNSRPRGNNSSRNERNERGNRGGSSRGGRRRGGGRS